MKNHKKRHSAFTLIEITVTVAMTSTLMLALGFAAFRTREPIVRQQQTLQYHSLNHKLRAHFNAFLAFATEINNLSAENITFTAYDPAQDTAQLATFAYRYDQDQKQIFFKNTTQESLLADNIDTFTITPIYFEPASEQKLSQIQITYTTTLSPSQTERVLISVYNNPTLNVNP